MALAVCVGLAVGSPEQAQALAEGGGYGGVSSSQPAGGHSRSYSTPRATASSGRITMPRRSRRRRSRGSGPSRRSSSSSTAAAGHHEYDYGASPGRSRPSLRQKSTVVIDNGQAIAVQQSANEQSFWHGVATGRVEAVSVMALGAYLYRKEKDSRWRSSGDNYAEYAAAAAAGGDPVSYVRELEETRKLLKELDAELSGSVEPAIEIPADGTYRRAESAEDDGGDLAALTTLRFHREGTVTGSGHDGVDGAYKIRSGRWSKRRVAWIEEYVEGITVALRGQVRPDGSILALWASSRGVGGSLELAPP